MRMKPAWRGAGFDAPKRTKMRRIPDQDLD
jgi:hypothetical protein